jgi:hypothetical protein
MPSSAAAPKKEMSPFLKAPAHSHRPSKGRRQRCWPRIRKRRSRQTAGKSWKDLRRKPSGAVRRGPTHAEDDVLKLARKVAVDRDDPGPGLGKVKSPCRIFRRAHRFVEQQHAQSLREADRVRLAIARSFARRTSFVINSMGHLVTFPAPARRTVFMSILPRLAQKFTTSSAWTFRSSNVIIGADLPAVVVVAGDVFR